MIPLEGLWDFICYRPGLSAIADEWRSVLGDDGWRTLRDWLFTGTGVAQTYIRPTDGQRLQVVPLRKGQYGLVCPVTGSLDASNLSKSDVTSYTLNVTALRRMVAEGLGITTDPKPVREVPWAFPVGNWEPTKGTNLPVFMILPPTARLLASEVSRLLVEHPRGFILLVPRQPKLSSALRAQLDRQKAMVTPLDEVLPCWESGQLSASPAWETYRNAYCQQHFTDRMVPEGPRYQFAKKGMWALRFEGKDTYLESELRGAAFIHYLIRHQGQQLHGVRMLIDVAGEERKRINAAAEGLETASGSAGELVDREAIKSCRDRYDSLVAERERILKSDHGDSNDRLAEIEKEIGQITAYLSASLGLGGRSRKAADNVAKVRRRIARVINITVAKIEKSDPSLAAHLRNSITTHTEMSYAPDHHIDWALE